MQDEAKKAELQRLKAELEELVRIEAECLRRAVDMVQNKAGGATIRAAYAEVEAARSRKNKLLRQLSHVSATQLDPTLPPPGARSGAGAAEAWPHLQNDERRRGRPDFGD